MTFSTCFGSKLPYWRQGGVLIALILFSIPIAANWYYGNLSTYTDSYFIHQVGVENHTSGSMWFLSLFMIAAKSSMLVGGVLANRFGALSTMVVSSLAFNAGIFATYFTIRQSFWGMNLTFGVFSGFFSGIVLGMGLLHAAAWFPRSVSLATSIVTSAYAGGSMILNPLISFYINPDDISPDMHTEKSSYFSDEDILERVPKVFLVLAAVFSVCHIIGAILLYICTQVSALGKPETPAHLASFTVKIEQLHSHTNKRESIIQPESSNVNFGSTVDAEDTTQALPKDRSNGVDQVDELTTQNQPKDFLRNKVDEPSIATQDLLQTHRSDVSEVDMTTREMLKTVLFYKTCCAMIPTLLVYSVGSNFYKQFGLVYINDDHFFATVGVCMSITACICRLLWGFVLDATSPQRVFLLTSALNCIMYAFWYFTPMVNKWFFLVSTLAIQMVQNSISLILPLMALIFFGKTHYVTNYGALNITSCLFVFLTPSLVEAILSNFGYFWVFLFVSLCNFISLCVGFCLPTA